VRPAEDGNPAPQGQRFIGVLTVPVRPVVLSGRRTAPRPAARIAARRQAAGTFGCFKALLESGDTLRPKIAAVEIGSPRQRPHIEKGDSTAIDGNQPVLAQPAQRPIDMGHA